jgi:purine-binding chemotaxis protein CheW
VSRINWDEVWQKLDWGSPNRQANLEETLAQRAEKYARPKELRQDSEQDTVRVLAFTRANERYAIPVSSVQQGMMQARLTPLPCVPAYYCGVINLRGQIVSVLDIRRLWGLPADPPDAQVRVIVIQPPQARVAGSAYLLALLADDVQQMVALPLHEIVPPVVAGVGLPHVQGVSPNGMVILDIDSLVTDRRLRVHEEL